MPIDVSMIRQGQSMFNKTWPKGRPYTMSNFTYFNKKFMRVNGYTWWLLPCVNSEGEPQYMGAYPEEFATIKFTLGGTFTTTLMESTTPRIGVLVETNDHLYHVHVDEEANLFMDKTSNECVGKVNVLPIDVWDGSVSLDTETIHRKYPFSVGRPKDWHHY